MHSQLHRKPVCPTALPRISGMRKLVYLFTAALFVSMWSVAPATDQKQDKSSEEMPNTSVVPSGTYTVTAERVDAKEKEIYAKTKDGKILELYLEDSTKLTQDGKPVQFNALKKGQQLEVKVEKKGNKLEPKEVRITGKAGA